MLLLFSNNSFCQPFPYPKNNPIELGKVKWIRDYDEAIRQSIEKDLPIFILFQEVPGCSNCTKFGNTVLSHPLIVEAIESCFVPLCIYNNKGGKDKLILEKFNEPSWNNPVIRIINDKGSDIVKRQADFRSPSETVSTIIKALESSAKSVDQYLHLLHQEMFASESNQSEEVYLSMYCFWTGEVEIADIPGVLGTEAGFMYGKEVVKVTYNKQNISLDEISEKAKSKGCADDVYGNLQKNSKVHVKPMSTYRKDREDKYHLRKSKYKAIPMTELQKTKINRAIAKGKDPSIYLSPRQLAILDDNDKQKNYVSEKIEDVWY
jgi:peptide methionine sulfoxide reductase MsrA